MKFLFCGNISCPEWFLAESAVLSKIVFLFILKYQTAIKLRVVAGHIIAHLIEGIENVNIFI
jgi:hypothetical protein